MASVIERLIEEIEDYIDGCKYQPLSNTKIIVNKDEIDELLRELRTKTPEELKRYQKVVSNQKAILDDAKKKAEALMSSAEERSNEMLSQNAIMQQAYAQADEVVKTAYAQAQAILNNATEEANMMRNSTIEYVDGLLAGYESLVSQTMRTTETQLNTFYSQLNQYYDTVVANRMELNPPTIDTSEIPADLLNGDSEADMNIGVQDTSSFTQDTGALSQGVNTGQIQGTGDTGDLKLDLLSS